MSEPKVMDPDELYWIRSNPEVLPPCATPGIGDADLARRIDARAAEHRPCYACQEPAQRAFIVHTFKGPRWLDLCHQHTADAAAANTSVMYMGDLEALLGGGPGEPPAS